MFERVVYIPIYTFLVIPIKLLHPMISVLRVSDITLERLSWRRYRYFAVSDRHAVFSEVVVVDCSASCYLCYFWLALERRDCSS